MKSEDVGLIVYASSFQDFQLMWSWSTNVIERRTDRQTDDMRLQDHALHCSASCSKNQNCDSSIHFGTPVRRMKVVSVKYIYFAVKINVTTATSLGNRKTNAIIYHPIHMSTKADNLVKTNPVFSEIYHIWQEKPTFANSPKSCNLSPRNFRGYWAEFHQICTQYKKHRV